jgi:hypothetical protein
MPYPYSGNTKLPVNEGHFTDWSSGKMAKKKRFVAFGFALLLTGLLVALDIGLAARTVDQLARSEVYTHAPSAQIWRSRVSRLRLQVKSKSGTTG